MSAIKHNGEPFIKLYKWQIDSLKPFMKSRNKCGAVLLSLFQYWHDGERKNSEKEAIILKKSIDEIHAGTYKMFSKQTVIESLNQLSNEGLIGRYSIKERSKIHYLLFTDRVEYFRNCTKNSIDIEYKSIPNLVKNYTKSSKATIPNLVKNYTKSSKATIPNLVCIKEDIEYIESIVEGRSKAPIQNHEEDDFIKWQIMADLLKLLNETEIKIFGRKCEQTKWVLRDGSENKKARKAARKLITNCGQLIEEKGKENTEENVLDFLKIIFEQISKNKKLEFFRSGFSLQMVQNNLPEIINKINYVNPKQINKTSIEATLAESLRLAKAQGY